MPIMHVFKKERGKHKKVNQINFMREKAILLQVVLRRNIIFVSQQQVMASSNLQGQGHRVEVSTRLRRCTNRCLPALGHRPHRCVRASPTEPRKIVP
jgi:hypothetical protein